MSPLLDQDKRFYYKDSANTDIGARFAAAWDDLGQLPPDHDPRVQRNRLRAQGFDLAMEERDAQMRRILDRVEAGAAQPGDLLAIRNYMGL
jgi:hypothetical protein